MVPGVVFTFVGTRHDSRSSCPDYLEGLIADSDVLFYEEFAWSARTAKRLQRLARGESRAKEQTLLIDEQLAREDESRSPMEVRHGEWDKVFHRALFRSGVRVVLPDYPETYWPAKSGQHERTLVDWSLALADGRKPPDKGFLTLAERDRFILGNVCRAIQELRSDPKLKARDPLRVLMAYGIMHMAIPDALAFTAQESGVDSFTAQSLFEVQAPGQVLGTNVRQQDRLIADRGLERGVVAYQNWLRRP